MTAQELSQIHARYFNGPSPVTFNDKSRYNRNLANRKPSKRPGIVIWNNGTFVGSIRQTFKLR